MTKYKIINNITGWCAFLVALITYLLTLEPTASFWDCGQFILLANSLQVGHPPGAPFYMLMANIFSQFASDPSQIAIWVNAFSAVVSAFSILFLFWTITHLLRKLLIGNADVSELSPAQVVTVIGSGLVGALAFTFSTSVWFSAVEAEVYAFSILMTAVVFWLILKWEDNADKPHADKWMVLIAYVMGLSIGVHLLNLLAIPAIVLVYYFKKKENPSWKGTLGALAVSFGLVLALMSGLIPGFTKVGGWFELFFVNRLGMSFNSGVFAYLILFVGSITWALFETLSSKGSEKRARFAFFTSLLLSGVLTIGYNPWIWALLIAAGGFFALKYKKTNIRFINLTMTCLMVLLIGYSSYAMLPIRSSANPPLDLNSPEDVFALGRVLNREQYGHTPLFHGTTFASQPKRDARGRIIVASESRQWRREVRTSPDQRDRYVYVTRSTAEFTNTMFFPRMHSHREHPAFASHIIGYERWGGVVDRSRPPTFLQNVRFLLDYQINFMYFRYLMWNFSGRQNDIQGDGGITSGNWITGIPFFDQHILGLGPQNNIAPDIADNRGRTTFFMLPFLLGILGILFQLQDRERGKQQFLVIFMFFFMTGVAIVLFLNQTPFEPRERDYSFVGSFYAFAIWIGMGVCYIALRLQKILKKTPVLAAKIAVAACLFVPILMASQNWDSHDRSGRTLARDMGMNYLVGLGENAIIFTNGDNDTFPLWYVQEVEGFRTDVRLVNLSFLQTEWYLDNLLLPAHESTPIPVNWAREQYWDSDRTTAHVISRREIENALRQQNVLPHEFSLIFDTEAFRDTVSLSQTLENLRYGQSRPNLAIFNVGNTQVVPSHLLYMNVDTARVDWASMNASPTERMTIDLGDRTAVFRQEIMIMEMLNNINNDNWEREIHFATTVAPDLFLNLDNANFSLNGMTFQVTPGTPLSGGVNTERAFDNMVNQFRFGGLEENPNIYLDETSRRMILTLRNNFIQLIHALIDEGQYDKARIALDRAVTAMPSSAVPFGIDGVMFAGAYYHLGETTKAEAILNEVKDRITRNLNWFERLRPHQVANSAPDILRNNINPLLQTARIYQRFDSRRYQMLVDDLLQRAQVFYLLGVPFIGDTILRVLLSDAMHGHNRIQQLAFEKATEGMNEIQIAGIPDMQELVSVTAQEFLESELRIVEEVMDKTLQMMQQFSPQLLQRFTGGE